MNPKIIQVSWLLGNSGMYFPLYRFVLRKIRVPFIFKLAFVYENYLHHRGRHCRMRQQNGRRFPFTSAHISKINSVAVTYPKAQTWRVPLYPLILSWWNIMLLESYISPFIRQMTERELGNIIILKI